MVRCCPQAQARKPTSAHLGEVVDQWRGLAWAWGLTHACLPASMPARAPACVRPSGPTRINSSEGQQQGQQQVLPQ